MLRILKIPVSIFDLLLAILQFLKRICQFLLRFLPAILIFPNTVQVFLETILIFFFRFCLYGIEANLGHLISTIFNGIYGIIQNSLVFVGIRSMGTR